MPNLYKELEQWGPVEGKPFYPSFWFYGMIKVLPTGLGTPWPVYIGIHERDRMVYFWEKDAIEKDGEAALEKWILNNKNRNKLWARYLSIWKQMKKSAPDLNPTQAFRLLTDFWTISCMPELATFAIPG